MTAEHRPPTPEPPENHPEAAFEQVLSPLPQAEQLPTYEKGKTITLHAYYIDKPEVERIYLAPNWQKGGEDDIYHKFLVALRTPGEKNKWLTVVERGEKALERWAKHDIQHNQQIELIGRMQKRPKKGHQQFWAFAVKPREQQ